MNSDSTNSKDLKSIHTNQRINGSERVTANTNYDVHNKTLKWIKIRPSSNSDNVIWKPVYILRSTEPNRKDCKYYIGRTAGNQYRQFHIDQLYDSPDYSKCSKKSILSTLANSLKSLFAQTTVCFVHIYS